LLIAEENPDAADRFLTAAKESFELLRRHPRIRRLLRFSVPGVWSWLIPEFQEYLILFVDLALQGGLPAPRFLPPCTRTSREPQGSLRVA
jgi:plasmid stabilization system protein ParE